MADRGVKFGLSLGIDKANKSVLKTFERSVTSTWERIEKKALASQASITKGTQKATDAQAKDGQRLTKSTQRMLGNREKLVTKSAEKERKERSKVTVSILKGMEREAKAQQQLQQKREAGERRANERIIRDRARASERLWKEAVTPMEKYRRKLQELERLSRQGIGTEEQRAAAAKKAYGVMQRETKKVKGGVSGLTGLIRGQTMAFEGMVSGMVGGMIGVGGIMAAVGLVTTAYAKWRAEMEALGKVSQEFYKAQLRDLGGAGDLPVASQLIAGMRAIGGVTREQIEQARLGIKDVLPSADVATQLSMMRAAAPMALIKGKEGMREYTGLMGILRSVAPEDRTDKQLAGLAWKLQQQAGVFAPQLVSPGFRKTLGVLKRSGVPFEEGLGFMGTALQQGMRPGSLAAEMGKVTMGREDVLGKVTKKTSPAVAGALQAFAGADTRQRLRLLQGSNALRREILGDASAVLLEGVTPEKVQAQMVEMFGAQQPGFIQQELEDYRRAPEGLARAEDQRLKVLDDRLKRREELRGERLTREKLSLETELRDKGPITKMLSRTMLWTSQQAEAMLGAERKRKAGDVTAARFYRYVEEGRFPVEIDIQARSKRLKAEQGIFRAEQSGVQPDKSADVEQAIKDEGEENRRAIKEQTNALLNQPAIQPPQQLPPSPFPQRPTFPTSDVQPRSPGMPPGPRGL